MSVSIDHYSEESASIGEGKKFYQMGRV